MLVFRSVQKAALGVFLLAGADQLQVAGRFAQNAHPQCKHDAICMLLTGLWVNEEAIALTWENKLHGRQGKQTENKLVPTVMASGSFSPTT